LKIFLSNWGSRYFRTTRKKEKEKEKEKKGSRELESYKLEAYVYESMDYTQSALAELI
jgi:hypothetical protein